MLPPLARRLAMMLLLAVGACGPGGTSGPAGAPGAAGAGGSGAGGAAGQPGGTGGRSAAGGGAGGAVSAGGGSGGDRAAPPDAPVDVALGTGGASGAGGATTDARAVDLPTVNPGGGPMPPATWQEHWFEHNQNVKLVSFDEHAAIYFDDAVPAANAQWLLPFVSRIWQYSKKTYGDGFGPDPRIFSIHHQGRYAGGHPSYYFDASHDNRNLSDCGPGPWTENAGAMDMVSHEIGHVVESANNGAQGSPGFPIWRDSKWAEFYQYDVYMALGLTKDAERLHARFSNTTDSFPRAGTRWFRDWFHPLWRDHGRAQVMVRFFQLLARDFPKRPGSKRYARDLNLGEYIHFTSGGAGKDLKALATAAFGWPPELEAQFQKARADFPMVTY